MSETLACSQHDHAMCSQQWCGCACHAKVLSPGDLRARIEQLRQGGTGGVIVAAYNRAISDVLALLGAAQEQP